MSETVDGGAATPPLAPDAAPLHRLIIAVVCLALAVVGLGVVVLVEMSDAKLAIVSGFVGAMFAWATAAVNYYIGSSAGSSAKDVLVGRLTGALR